jgi:hypothetical protein
MGSKSRTSACLSLLAAVAAAISAMIGGCTLDKDGKLPGNVFTRIGGHSGEVIEPKRCLLKVAIISRPFGDPAVNEAIWHVADEQTVPPSVRRSWEANGLRIGRIVGELPNELEAILKDTTPQNKVNPATFFIEDGRSSLIRVSDSVEEASLLLNRDNRSFGRDFRDVSGFFRVTAQHEGRNEVSIKMTPEIQHGPIQRTFQAQPNAAAMAPQEFTINTGQQEETIRELAATMVLDPGQVAVIGSRPEQKRSLGSFMLTQAVAHSDQRLEKVILIWASRNLTGQGPNDGAKTNGDRPQLRKGPMGPLPPPSLAMPAAPEPLVPSPDQLAPRGVPGSPTMKPTSSPAQTAAQSTAPANQNGSGIPVPKQPSTTAAPVQSP